MKYLVNVSPTLTLIPPEQSANMVKAAMSWCEENAKNGKLECNYIFAEGAGGILIVNVNSHEELFDLLISCPTYPLATWEVKPLCDWKYAFNSVIAST